MNKVSVVIPCYNTEKFLGRAIESCINQTIRPIQVIIPDDLIVGKAPAIVTSSTVIVPKSVLDTTGYFDEALKAHQDADLWLRIARKFPLDYVGEYLTNVQYHSGNSRNDLPRTASSYEIFCKKQEPYILSGREEEWSALKSSMFRLFAVYAYQNKRRIDGLCLLARSINLSHSQGRELSFWLLCLKLIIGKTMVQRLGRYIRYFLIIKPFTLIAKLEGKFAKKLNEVA